MHHKKVKNQRLGHDLILSGASCTLILTQLVQHCVLKRGQAELALEYLTKLQTNRQQPDWHDYELKVAIQLSSMKTLAAYNAVSVEPVQTRLTPAYLAGFFDAEGSIGVYKRPAKGPNQFSHSVCFAQKNSDALLRAILVYFDDRGSLHNGQAIIARGAIRDVLQAMLPHLIVKKSQAALCLQYLDGQVDPNECVKHMKLLKRS